MVQCFEVSMSSTNLTNKMLLKTANLQEQNPRKNPNETQKKLEINR